MCDISIIIPIYNAEKYLLQTVQCLQKQSLSDFEVILIDDGSKDASAVILKKIAEQDSRFRYVYQENQGVSAARNHGLAICKGKYVTFIDADDVLPENYLEKLHETLVRNNCQMSIADVAVIDNGVETMRFTCTKPVLLQREALNLILSRRKINSGPCAKMFRREVLNKLKYPPLKAYEDMLFVLSAVSNCEYVAVTTETEYRYIQNVGSAMSNFLKIPTIDIVTATDQIVEFVKSRKDLDPLCMYTTLSHLMQYVQPLLYHNDEKARSFVCAAKQIYKKNLSSIWRCSAFPYKEKITYILFAFGWIYQNHKLKRMR